MTESHDSRTASASASAVTTADDASITGAAFSG